MPICQAATQCTAHPRPSSSPRSSSALAISTTLARASRSTPEPKPKPNPAQVDSCTALSLADLPAEWVRQHGIVVGTRGVGFWRWKAYTILQRLSSMADGEVLRP